MADPRCSCPVYLQLQEVCCAGNARVMVAYALLATSLQRIVCEIESGIRDFSHIFLDDALVLRGRRNETGVEDRAVAIEIVTVVEYAARRFTAGVAHSGIRLGRDKGQCWRLVGGDQ